MKKNALSLFANIGVAEAYLEEIGVNVVLASELLKRRADLYSRIYPQTEMICGDITQPHIYDAILRKGHDYGIDVVMATPPCQGMSTAGQQVKFDKRNNLIIPVIRIIKDLKPSYVFIENVPMFLNTSIENNGGEILIPDLLDKELSKLYSIDKTIIDTKNYLVPQTRERVIILMTRKPLKKWTVPKKEKKVVTMEDAIGHLPVLDPFVRDVSDSELRKMFPKFIKRKAVAAMISRWHTPPCHIRRQVEAMMYTPTGKTAFDNSVHFPRKHDGMPVRGFRNTYKRQNWDSPAYTVTMDNRKISSQNNVHPGRFMGKDKNGNSLYSDPRALTLYELMIISTLPQGWNIPEDTPQAFLRSIIGEGIPPLFVKKVFKNIGKG